MTVPSRDPLASAASCAIIAAVDDFEEGRIRSARAAIREVQQTGVTGIKLVAGEASEYATCRVLSRAERCGMGTTTFHDAFQKFRLVADLLTELREAVEGLTVIVAPYDVKSLTRLEPRLVDIWQVDEACNTNIALLHELNESGRRLYYLTGGCSRHEIEQAVSILKGTDLLLLHRLRHTSPAVLLNDFATLQWLRGLGFPIGCYDAHLDPYPTCLSLTLGVRVIEKPVWSKAAYDLGTPAVQLTSFVRRVRETEELISQGPMNMYVPEEIDAFEDVRTGLVATQTIRPGAILSREMVTVKAPAVGLSPTMLPFVLGREVLYDLQQDDPITFGVLG